MKISTGAEETIVTDTSSCDPAHRTPWGSIVFGEEEDDGRLYELIDPLNTTDVVLDRATGQTSGTGADNIVQRDALGFLAFEGIGILPSGVVYYGDENRPFEGAPGGAYYRFIPTQPWAGGTIGSLDESPLTDGTVYGLRLGKRDAAGGGEPDPGTDYGHGTNLGLGTWIQMTSDDLRAEAASQSLTGYYRPEDLALDQRQLRRGRVTFCGANTGNEDEDHFYGETICVSDGTLETALANAANPEVQILVPGNPELAMMDNIAYQPVTGNWLINEDGAGKRYFVSIQHNITGSGVV